MKKLLLALLAVLFVSQAHAQSNLFVNSTTGFVGIGTTTPGAMLDVGAPGATLGTMRLDGNTSGYVQLQPAAAAGSWSMTLPANAGTNGYVLQTNGSGVTSWVANTATTAVSTQTGSTYTYVAGDQGNLKERSNSGTAMADTLPGTSPGVMAAGWVVTVANTDASALMSVSAGTGATLKGAPQGFLILGPNQQATIASDGTNYNVVTAPARTRLGANTTIYVSTSGSNSNTALTSSVPFLTIQKAIDVVVSYYDLNGYILTVQLVDGTYTAGASVTKPWVGGNASNVILNGNSTTPSNVFISTTGTCVYAAYAGSGLTVQNVKLQTGEAGLRAIQAAQIYFSNLVFGTATNAHIQTTFGGFIMALGSYSIVGSAPIHIITNINGEFTTTSGITVTLTGTPNFSNAFVYADEFSYIEGFGFTFSGSATGKRYFSSLNSVVDSAGHGANFFPGNVAGTTQTGGQYGL